MKTNPNSLIGKQYDKDTYHCWHFIEEVMHVPLLQDVHVDHANDDVEKHIGKFEELDAAENNCIVLIGKSHIGIWYNGGIYHNDVGGVRYETHRVMRMKYPGFRYFKVKQ